MPIHSDFQKMLDRMIKQYGKEKGTSVFYAYCKSKGLDYSKPYPGKKEGVEIRICEKLRFSVPFVVESVEGAVEEAASRKVKGTMLKATTSRNGRTYFE